jgi:hypothetical protein
MAAQSTYTDTMDIGYAGQIDYKSNPQFISMRNDEASAEIEIGAAVKYDDVSGDKSSAALLSAITGEIVPGIVAHSDTYDSTDLGDDGVLPDRNLSVMTKGRMLVVCEDGCSVGDRLHIRAVVTGAEVFGALLAAADGSDTIASTGQGRWTSIAAAGGLAWLEFDFTNPLT